MQCARLLNNYIKKSLKNNLTRKLFYSTKRLNNDIESVILKEDNKQTNNKTNNNKNNNNKKIINNKQKLILLYNKMNEAYFRHDDKNDNFTISFRLVDNQRNIDKQLNFIRKIDSTVSNLLSRIDINVTKILNKKIQKKKKKKKNNDTIPKEKTKVEVDEEELESKIEECKSSLLINNKIIDKESICKNIFNSTTKAKLIILGKEIKIIYNAPWINDIKLSKCILVNYPTYPTKFDSYLTDRNKSIFTWYKTKQNDNNDNNWQKLYQGYIYTPDINDIGYQLKLQCIPINSNDETGPIFEIKSLSTVETGPGICPFEIRHSFTKEKLSRECFRITSYNILADFYTDSDYSRDILFPYCPSYALEIDYRKQLIIKELIGYNADIICLQEVDNKIFDCDLIPILTNLDYDGFYNRKGGSVREGLATFYNNKRFEKLDFASTIMSENIDINGFNEVWKLIDNDKMKERFLCRSTSVQATTLQSIDNPTEILIIGNTHLYFHPDADHIRLLQCYYALVYIRNIADKCKEKYKNKNISILLCGDFNSVPDCGIYQLMINKIVPNDYKDWKSNTEEIQTTVKLSNDISFASACGTPKYTNFTVGFADCLDYIFYQTDRLNIQQVIPMPSNEDLTEHTALPSIVFPSDHISLCADLKWKL